MATCSKQLTLFFAWNLLRLSLKSEKSRLNSAKRRKENPEKVKAAAKKWRLENKEKDRAWAKRWTKNNPEKSRAIKQRYKKRHPDKVKAQSNARAKIRRKTDFAWQLKKNCRDRVYKALKGHNKAAKTMELLGCSIEFLREHLAKQFQPGKIIADKFYPDMTWENHGSVWHVDHIRPCVSFDLSKPEQQRACFHWTNLQPLFAPDNQSKGDQL